MTETTLTLYRRSELEEVNHGCLHRVNMVWNLGVPDESDIARLGIAFHRVNHAYIQKLVEWDVEADSELAQRAFTEGVALAQTPTWLLPELREVWERHAERFELNTKTFVAAEERETSGQRVFTPDLVTAEPRINELEIHDFKSGWQPPLSEDEVRGLYQARAYTLFAKDRWPGFSSYRFTIHAVRFNVGTSVQFSDAELDQIEREVKADIATIEHAKLTNHWPAVAGPSCRFCTLACPLMDETPALMPKRLLEPAQAQKLAGWVLAADGMVKQAKSALKAYVSAHGAVGANGVMFDNRPYEERKYAIDVVLEVLRLNNISGVFEDPKQQDLTISHSALKKIFKLYPSVEQDLSTRVQTKTKYRFSAKQPGVDEGDE